MQRLVPFLALGIALGFSAAAFLVVNPPPAFRVIRYDGIAVNLYNFTDPCMKDAKSVTCPKARRPRAHDSGPPAQIKFKMADPFWDRA